MLCRSDFKIHSQPEGSVKRGACQKQYRMIAGVRAEATEIDKAGKTETTPRSNRYRTVGHWGEGRNGQIARQKDRDKNRRPVAESKTERRQSSQGVRIRVSQPLSRRKVSLTHIFRTPSFCDDTLSRRTSSSWEDINTTAKKELPFRVTKTHFRPHRPSPRLSCTWKAAEE